MNIKEMTVCLPDLLTVVESKVKEGHRLMCMYVQEPTDNKKRQLQILMASADGALMISVEIENGYGSLTSVIPSGIYEREIMEMSGVSSIGNDDMRPLKLRYITEGAYPLQKVMIPTDAERILTPIPHNGMDGDGIFEIPVGPIHAGVIEPNHFRFSVAGEPILMMRTYLGYAHRGIEKLMETDVLRDNTKLAERISGDNCIAHCLAYLQAIERDTDIPLRAKYIRTILAELERIQCHLGGITGIATDTALSVPAAFGSGIRERMLRLNEGISGNRWLKGMLIPGGVNKDLLQRDADSIFEELARLKRDLASMLGSLKDSPSFTDRVENTGILSKEDAERSEVVGPVARSSGVGRDIRKEHPYEAYGLISPRVSVREAGDVYSRLMIKAGEIENSIDMISQCLGSMKDGPILTEVKEVDGLTIGVVESPRGETVHCIHVVNGRIWRYKIRDASFVNWPALEIAVSGNIIPDFPLINKSFDLSCSGNDL